MFFNNKINSNIPLRPLYFYLKMIKDSGIAVCKWLKSIELNKTWILKKNVWKMNIYQISKVCVSDEKWYLLLFNNLCIRFDHLLEEKKTWAMMLHASRNKCLILERIMRNVKWNVKPPSSHLLHALLRHFSANCKQQGAKNVRCK